MWRWRFVWWCLGWSWCWCRRVPRQGTVPFSRRVGAGRGRGVAPGARHFSRAGKVPKSALRRPLPLCLRRTTCPRNLLVVALFVMRQMPPCLPVAVVGAHTAQPLAALPLTDAAYPLRVLCARSIDTHRTGEGRAHTVRPYICFHEPRPMPQCLHEPRPIPQCFHEPCPVAQCFHEPCPVANPVGRDDLGAPCPSTGNPR